MTATRLADEPHHDGSPTYTRRGPDALGDTIQVRLRVPAAASATRVRVRTVPDAEPVMVEARLCGRSEQAPAATFWVADLELHNPITRYRFLLEGGSIGYAWVTQAGIARRDVSDATDFIVSTEMRPPDWLGGSVGYQIFLDRFARSNAPRDTPAWAIAAAWDEPITTNPDVGTRQWYGGDLAGVEAHLDHLEQLGVNLIYLAMSVERIFLRRLIGEPIISVIMVTIGLMYIFDGLIYLTPFFPSGSSHRYDAASFDQVDPALGGNEALASLIAAAHARDIRVIGDITLNHTGDQHEWFRIARTDPASPEAGFYMFGDGPHRADDYVSWHGGPSLPKLDHRSDELAARLYRGDRSVIAKYLAEPF